MTLNKIPDSQSRPKGPLKKYPSPEAPGELLFEEILPGASMWSWTVRRHTTLRLSALEDGANVGFLAFQAEDRLNRLNVPDTLKAQHTAKLSRGNLLMSDMGHALFSITGDSLGWHDPLGGHGNAALLKARYGEAAFQEHRNNFYRNAHDCFLIELTKHGLGARDLVANINFFSRLDVDDMGRIHYHPGHAKAGDYVDLRAEMNVLVILNTCQHPLDPEPVYAPKRVHLALYKTPAPAEADYCRHFRSENDRCLTLTERLFAGL